MTRKRRAAGTACVGGRRCIAQFDHNEHRYCAKHLADVLFAEEIRASLDGSCWAAGAYNVSCGGGLQCAHIFSRRYHALRWDEDNARPMCQAHHFYFTGRPAEWEDYCRDRRVNWDGLRMAALNNPPMDPLAVVARYT